MKIIFSALALVGSVIGAGFASGREVARFFSGYGVSGAAAALCAAGLLTALLLRIVSKMERAGAGTAAALCRARFGEGLGSLCAALFFMLFSVTAGAMLAACAEIAALTLPVHHAYGFGLSASLLLALLLAHRRARGLALAGGLLVLALPVLLVRLLLLPAGEACFYPAMAPDLPVRAVADGVSYAALNAALLLGTTPLLLSLDRRQRRCAAMLFGAVFLSLLLLASLVCRRHLSVALSHPMPFLMLSRRLEGGYLLFALCLYAAALSTLCAMLTGLMNLLPLSPLACCSLSGAAALLFARLGFTALVHSAYPVLGAVCAGLLILLCV